MRRIVFLCPFSRSDITGGTKTVYRHAELLTQSGLDAWIWQPEGKPPWIESTARILQEPRLFRPRQKRMEIAFVPRKLPRESAAIHRMFHLKYPAHASAAWVAIENRSERETAEIFGHAAIVLSLPFLESFGLVPLEAMACGAVVAGFDGYGGREYATPENGIWLPSDHLEEAADALALLIQKLLRNDPEIARTRDAGFATVARYSKENARAALLQFYTPLVR